ncbi:hypothetical protein OHC33_004188 [Knufia fluminis]|uniref:Thioredoxin domain-containing protein n=1 Tax=Knufia fluminis TaxID=191047 RepID=A0AAN8EV57_9EURO|nr:hypothetical protein OHC33_004188 [Knufia fluminis]
MTVDQTNNGIDRDDDTDAILAELEAEAEDTSSAAYQQRVKELQAEAGKSSTNGSSGMPATTARQDSYLYLRSDDETLRFTTEHERAIVHFRHSDFARCAIMDEHLDRIAQRHSYTESSGEEIAFARVDVTNTPFVVEKLGIRVLPCVIGFAKGIAKGKVVGFEGICWDGREKDAKVSRALEERLCEWGLLRQKMLADEHDTDSDDEGEEEVKSRRGINGRRGITGAKQKVTDEADDWD